MWAIVFWAVALFTANSALGLVRALIDPAWYEAKARASRVKPDFQRLIVAKGLSIGAGVLFCYLAASNAGYIH
jgi:hypothetical protein